MYQNKRVNGRKLIRALRKTMKKRKENKEKGCTEPLYDEKSKCVLRVIPQTEKCESLEVDSKGVKTRGTPA